MAYFECVVGGGGTSLTIQITTSSTVLYGQTITISKGGSTVGTTAFDNTGNAEYTVRESGTYTVSVTYSGTTFSDTVTVADTFNVNVEATPTGSTATPVNDIQTWLHCANVWNKNYTNISQVLADTTTLLALINSNNAVDYMVRSTNWATSVCANSTAMTYIGANNYCANKLLSNSTWCTAICNSTYFESVLNVKVPTMTSNTTPSGIASASSEYQIYYAYYAFDNNASQHWSANSANNQRITYKFDSAIKCIYAKLTHRTLSGYDGAYWDCKIQGSDDNANWTDLVSSAFNYYPTKDDVSKILNTSRQYNYYSLYFGTRSSTNLLPCIGELQFYGRSSS